MRKHRFFVAEQLTVGSNVNLPAEISHYISRVLRLKTDDIIYVFNNSGFEFTAAIHSLTKNTVSINIINAMPDTQESPLKINLAQVIAKGEKMDLVIQKATELGVTTITPLFSERTVVKKIAEKSEHKLEHWQKIAIAASCQCWRNYVPVINQPQALNSWLQQSNITSTKLILTPSNKTQQLKNLNPAQEITLLIGPEGGFSDTEINTAQDHNFLPISLGPRILRTETAGIAAIAILQALYGDC